MNPFYATDLDNKKRWRIFTAGEKMGFWRKLWWILTTPIGEETDEDDD